MFVIADTRRSTPMFLRRILHNGFATGTVSLGEALTFKTRIEAQSTMGQIKDFGPWVFKIHELGIKGH